MKYKELDIDHLCNHKMLRLKDMSFNQSQEDNSLVDQEIIGIAKRWGLDERFNFDHKDKYLKRMKFRFIGAKQPYDNICCNGQEINFISNDDNKIAILGFCGYHTYNEEFSFVTKNNECINKRILLYHHLECLDSLYNSEKDENCKAWLRVKMNTCKNMYYYFTIKDMPEHTCKIILPFNPDMHIAAITIFK